MNEQIKLVQKVKNYFPKLNVENINKAYDFGKKAHENQTRASGDPFFTHPFEVANILAQMKLDENSIITGLLHDVIPSGFGIKSNENFFLYSLIAPVTIYVCLSGRLSNLVSIHFDAGTYFSSKELITDLGCQIK